MAKAKSSPETVSSDMTSDSDAPALTPEERDEQIIAKFMGMGASSGEEEAEETEDESGVGEQAVEESESVAEDEESEEEEVGESEGEEAEIDLDEISDDDLEALLDVLEPRLLEHPRVKKTLEERAKAEADRRFEERRKAELQALESEQLVLQGRTAVERLMEVYDKLHTNLKKALEGEDAEAIEVSRDELLSHLGAFGAAAVAETRKAYDDAFTTAFREAVQLTGEMNDDDRERVVKIVQTAARIAADPKQGQVPANTYLFTETIKFLTERAREAGRKEAEAEFLKRREALKKLAKDTPVKAAIAKITNARKKLPTKPTPSAPASSEDNISIEAYRAAKAAGDYEKADAIVQALAAKGIGVPIR
jgi:hypothetical protein